MIVLDIMLPELDGLSVCRTMRAQGVQTPVLMLTARDTVDDRVTGLDGCAFVRKRTTRVEGGQNPRSASRLVRARWSGPSSGVERRDRVAELESELTRAQAEAAFVGPGSGASAGIGPTVKRMTSPVSAATPATARTARRSSAGASCSMARRAASGCSCYRSSPRT